MDYIEDPTPLLMDVAKDEKGREATELGYEEQDEYRDHLIRISFDRNEQHFLDLLLLELMEEFGMYIGNDEMTTLENANVQKAIEISRKYIKEDSVVGLEKKVCICCKNMFFFHLSLLAKL